MHLANVAATAADQGDHDRADILWREAHTIVHATVEDSDRPNVLAEMVIVLAGAGHHDRAEEILGSIPQSPHSQRALESVIEAIAGAGEHDRAERLARALGDRTALRLVAVALAQGGDRSRALALLSEVKASLAEGTRPDPAALRSLAEAMARCGCPDEAESIALTIADRHQQAETLRTIIGAVDPTSATRLLVRRLELLPWYDSALELYSLAREAFTEAVDELLGQQE